MDPPQDHFQKNRKTKDVISFNREFFQPSLFDTVRWHRWCTMFGFSETEVVECKISFIFCFLFVYPVCWTVMRTYFDNLLVVWNVDFLQIQPLSVTLNKDLDKYIITVPLCQLTFYDEPLPIYLVLHGSFCHTLKSMHDDEYFIKIPSTVLTNQFKPLKYDILNSN